MTNGLRSVLLEMLKRPTARDKQRLIGPSSLGNPCDYCLAQELLEGASDEDVEPEDRPYWLGAVLGTATHMLLEDRVPKGCKAESRVTIGEIPGYGVVSGSTDLMRLKENQVVDWKGFSLDTKLPTPTGWTTMGDVSIGDFLLDRAGNPTKVIGKSGVKTGTRYLVHFKDNINVVTDADHLWWVDVRKRGQPFLSNVVKSTPEILAYLAESNPSYSVIVKNTKPIVGCSGASSQLPIDPYVLGVWLGDGSSDSASVHNPDKRVWDMVRARGFVVGERFKLSRENGCEVRTIFGLYSQLKEQGLLRNKHVPEQYFRASIEDRLLLLQGLMDTDGYYNKKRKRFAMNTTADWLANAIYELAASMGWTVQRSQHMTRWQNGEKLAWYVEFRPTVNVFLARQDNALGCGPSFRTTQRYITRVDELDTGVTQCVMVDSPDSSFLCTEGFVPTHNTTSREKLKNLKLAFETKPSPYDPDPLLRARFTHKKYIGQIMSYGWGWEQAGYQVDTVGFGFICRDGLTDNDVWCKELAYDRAYAEQVWARVNRVWQALQEGRKLDSFLSKTACYSCMTTAEPRKFSKRPY